MLITLIVEVIVFVITVVLAVFWAINPAGNYEPYTVICGCVTIGIDLYRRYIQTRSNSNTVPTSQSEFLLTLIREKIDTDKLSEVLFKCLKLAKSIEDTEWEHWLNLELFGYSETGGFREGDEVPEYREAVGRYYDQFGRMLELKGKELEFINTHRFREGIEELEKLSQHSNLLAIIDQDMIEMMREKLNVDVVCFQVSPIEITSILNRIRCKLLKKIDGITL